MNGSIYVVRLSHDSRVRVFLFFCSGQKKLPFITTTTFKSLTAIRRTYEAIKTVVDRYEFRFLITLHAFESNKTIDGDEK